MTSGIWNPCEHPYTLLLAAAAVQFVMMIVHMVRPASRKWWHIVPAAVLVILAFALDYFVATDMEKIQTLMRSGVYAAQVEDVPKLEAMIAGDYRDSLNKTKADLCAVFQKWLWRPLIEKNNIQNLTVQINGADAAIAISVVIHIDKASDLYSDLKIVWLKARLNCRKYGDQWLVQRMEMVELNNQKVDWSVF